ncbi:hypothetical protein WJX79_000742 [Trebouxia sp. C0005]
MLGDCAEAIEHDLSQEGGDSEAYALRTGTREVMGRQEACVHLALATAFAAVWGWHLTPQANSQEVAKKFGWFFNYLTFFSFSVQLLQFFVCLLADFKPKRQLISISNDLSCSVFGMAVFVTMSYYYLLFKGEIEDSDKAPAWISPVLHTGNVNDMEQPFGMIKTAAALMAIVAAIFMLARVSLVPKDSKAHSA